jgi:uncharacterized membrane protein
MSMLVWFYMTEGVVRGLTDPSPLSRALAWSECALALVSFGVMAATLRTHARRPASLQAGTALPGAAPAGRNGAKP